jgi:UDP-N-acetylglucosamine 2-epimerase
VKVALVGDELPAAEAALEAEGDVELIGSLDARAADRDGEIPRLAAALRAFESRFEEERVDRVVVTGSSNPSLAAVLVATKMLIPVVAVVRSDGAQGADGPSAMNARLIAHLADATLGADANAVAEWLREPQQPSQGEAEH